MKTIFVLLYVAMLTACGGASESGSNEKYFFENYKGSSYSVWGPYPSLDACATARSRFPSYSTTGCHL